MEAESPAPPESILQGQLKLLYSSTATEMQACPVRRLLGIQDNDDLIINCQLTLLKVGF